MCTHSRAGTPCKRRQPFLGAATQQPEGRHPRSLPGAIQFTVAAQGAHTTYYPPPVQNIRSAHGEAQGVSSSTNRALLLPLSLLLFLPLSPSLSPSLAPTPVPFAHTWCFAQLEPAMLTSHRLARDDRYNGACASRWASGQLLLLLWSTGASGRHSSLHT